MRKLIRVLLGVALFGAFLTVLPAPAALANHDLGAAGTSNTPAPAGSAGNHGDITNGWHEEMPNPRYAGFERDCAVVGTVKGGEPPQDPRGHNPFPPEGIDDPAHSHFEFIQTQITCINPAAPVPPEVLTVIARGGNDGHIVPWEPVGSLPETDMVTPNCTFQHPVSPQPHGKHHGSMTESGWSHSSGFNDTTSGYDDPDVCTEHNGGESGACVAGTVNNKANIEINGDPVSRANFVKYIRLGNIVYAWGCSNSLAPARRFSAVLAIAPDPRDSDFPVCVLPEALRPVGMQGCDLLLTGPAHRSAAWLPQIP